MTILITGARGQVGSRVLDLLHAAGHTLRASARDSAELNVPAGVETTSLDLTRPDTFDAALRGVTKVFLYAKPAAVKDLVSAAEEAGVQYVVLLSSSTVLAEDAETDPLALDHLVVERALTASGLATTLLRPGAFAGNALGWRDAVRRRVPLELPYLDARVAPIHEADIADVAVAALTGDSLVGRALTLSGPEALTFHQQINTIASLLGHEIPVHELSRDEAVEQLGRFVPAPILGSLLNQWAAAVERPDVVSDVTERVTGRPGRTFRQWAEENIGAFTG